MGFLRLGKRRMQFVHFPIWKYEEIGNKACSTKKTSVGRFGGRHWFADGFMMLCQVLALSRQTACTLLAKYRHFVCQVSALKWANVYG